MHSFIRISRSLLVALALLVTLALALSVITPTFARAIEPLFEVEVIPFGEDVLVNREDILPEPTLDIAVLFLSDTVVGVENASLGIVAGAAEVMQDVRLAEPAVRL